MHAFSKILLPVAASFVCLTASAGTKIDYFLSVDMNNHSAYGALGSVRRDTIQSTGYIGCSLMAGYFAAGDLWIQCLANGTGGSITCLTNVTSSVSTSPMVKALQSLTTNSFLYFTWDPNQTDGVGPRCTSIQVATGSMLYPLTF